MRRRAALRSLAALSAGLAGCGAGLPSATGPRRPPESASPPPTGETVVEVVGVDVEQAPDGDVRVTATVRNRGDEPTTREVVATATLDGDERVRSVEVRLGADGETEATVDFEFEFVRFVDGDGSVSVDVA